MLTFQGARTLHSIDPSVRQRDYPDYYFRLDTAPASIRVTSSVGNSRWQVMDQHLQAVPFTLDPSQPRSVMFARPRAADCYIVTHGRDQAKVWFVTATVLIRRSGPAMPEDARYAAVVVRLRNRYGTSYSFDRLGKIQFATDGQTMGNTFSGHRYGDFFATIGTVSPSAISETGIRFFIARRITGGVLAGWDARGGVLPQPTGRTQADGPIPARCGPDNEQPVAGTNDTSVGQNGRFDSAGRLFDYDFPGALFTAAHQRGDRHQYRVSFETCVAVGQSDRPNLWQQITQQGDAVSPLVPVQVDLTATVRQQATTTQNIDLTLS